MKFWEAMKGMEEGNKYTHPLLGNKWIEKRFTSYRIFPDNENYRPTVTELNDDEWRYLGAAD